MATYDQLILAIEENQHAKVKKYLEESPELLLQTDIVEEEKPRTELKSTNKPS